MPSVDVVLENYGPGTMERLGCGYEQLAPLNPHLVFLALKGYLAGPYEHRPALDKVVQFQTGLAFMTGPPGQPLRAGASVIDIAVQAALRERDGTGKGQPRSAGGKSAAPGGAALRAGECVMGTSCAARRPVHRSASLGNERSRRCVHLAARRRRWQLAGLPALPLEFGSDRRRPGLRLRPPRIGEHNADVLSEAGFTGAEIARLADTG